MQPKLTEAQNKCKLVMIQIEKDTKLSNETNDKVILETKKVEKSTEEA